MATWKSLLDTVRDQLSDPDKSSWSDDQLIRYFGEAQERACREGYLMRASKTVTLVSGTRVYSYPTNAIYIVRMKWGGSNDLITHRTANYMDRNMPGWESQEGSPASYITDITTKKFSIHRVPDDDTITESDTLTLTCVMLPSAAPTKGEFEDGATTPEIEPEHHFELIDYVMYRAHNQDSRAEGKKLAASDFAQFQRNMEMAKREFIMQRSGKNSQFPRFF